MRFVDFIGEFETKTPKNNARMVLQGHRGNEDKKCFIHQLLEKLHH